MNPKQIWPINLLMLRTERKAYFFEMSPSFLFVVVIPVPSLFSALRRSYPPPPPLALGQRKEEERERVGAGAKRSLIKATKLISEPPPPRSDGRRPPPLPPSLVSFREGLDGGWRREFMPRFSAYTLHTGG